MSGRSDIQNVLDEQRRRPDWPSERYLIASFAIQVASAFEQLREQQGLTYDQLAEKAGTSKAQVIRLLSGTYGGISNRSLAKLCKALGCEIKVQVHPIRRSQPEARPRTTAHRLPSAIAAPAPAYAFARTSHHRAVN